MNKQARKAWAARQRVVSSRPLFALPFSRVAGLALALAFAPGCKPAADEPLGPAPSFMLFEAQGEAHGLPIVAGVKATEGTTSQVTAALNEGFAAELLRTVYVTQQYIGNARTPTGPSARALAWAKDATPFVLNAPQALGFGVALSGAWLGGPVPRPQTIFVGIPAAPEAPQLVPLLARRIGGYLGLAAATAGEFNAKSHLLANAYAQALEVIAREWKGTGKGAERKPLGEAEANLFTGVRENRFVLDDQGNLIHPAEMLANEGVAATVFYRWFQDKQLMKTVATDAFYEPLKNDRVPPGVSPAVVLGTFRNLQMKVLGAWINAVRAGQPPHTMADLVRVYGEQFPAERARVVALFVATTYGATVKPPGLSPKPADADGTMVALTALTQDVLSGKTPLVSSP